MRLTTKGRFAVTAMIDLALRQHEGPVTLAGISERQKISLSYLEQLFGKLRRQKLVTSIRGPGGGYCLARPVAVISVADIIRAVDGPLTVVQGERPDNLEYAGAAAGLEDVWLAVRRAERRILESVTLQHLSTGKLPKEVRG